jgi:thioredoxin 1
MASKSVPCTFMDNNTYFEKIRNNPRPIVVDLWAPWCGPCKMVKPILEKLAQEYAGRVDLWQINADDNQELLHSLGVFGIPTLIIYQGGKETLRYTGAKSASTLQTLFETLSHGEVLKPGGLSGIDRFLRFGAGLAVVAIGMASNSSLILYALGGILLFSAIYDRCPIWRAITAQFKKPSSGA